MWKFHGFKIIQYYSWAADTFFLIIISMSKENKGKKQSLRDHGLP